MKKITKQFLGLALVGLILGGCSQTATFDDADVMNEQAAEKGGFKLDPFGTNGFENASLTSCVNCVESPFIESFTTTLNNNNNYADVEVWNDMENFYIKVTANGSNTMDEIKLSYPFSSSLNGPVQNCNFVIDYNYTFNNGGVPFSSHTFEFPIGVFETDWDKCDLESFALRVAGISGNPVFLKGSDGTVSGTYYKNAANPNVPYTCNTVPTSVGYYLHEICVPECDKASFSYETADNQNIVFTYNHGEEVNGLTLQFTFSQIVNLLLNEDDQYVAPDGKIYEVNNPKNQTVFTWTGFVSCDSEDAETFTFSMSADCGPSTAKDGQAIIWTDTKVVAINGVELVDDILTPENEGPYSIKGGLANIVYTGCPVNP